MSRTRSTWETSLIRTWILTGGMLLFLAGLGAKLWAIQVVHGPAYRDQVRAQSLRSVRIPAWRGRLYDRNGVVLAENRASHCIALYPEELRKPGQSTRARVEAVVAELERRLGVPPDVQPAQIERHLSGKERLLPLILWKDLDAPALARWAERVTPTPGLDIYTQPVRVYPLRDRAAHTLGYVRDVIAYPDEGEIPEAAGTFDLYLPEMQGKLGLEKALDDRLRGRAGGELFVIDSLGYRHALLERRAPVPGHDFLLTLDARMQSLAEEILGEEPGAVVVVDPRQGEVLALASAPRFDANRFIPRLPPELFQSINADPRKPWINRPVQMTYYPGSTFKMIVALAAQVNERVPLGRTYDCPGYIEIGGRRMHCANRLGHGELNLRQAIERSCNVYFFHLGLETGYEYTYHMAHAVGLGQRTGIELGAEFERPGLVGDSAYKRRVYGDSWRDGDTCNVSIGQGMVDVTPLQMAMFTAALANGGTLYRPRLVLAERTDENSPFVRTPPRVANTLNWPREALAVIRAGMRDVVMSPQGTGRAARVEGLDYAAKTGTAQIRSRDHTNFQAWMVAYAPAQNPRFAIALVLDLADPAALSIGPKMKRLLEGLFALPPGEIEGGAS
jgi:penicillin-binding protein 2